MNVSNARRFALQAAIVAAIVCLIPSLYAMWVAPPGSVFAGVTYNFDDQMVYAAWMRQAMDGAFLFDNRFTVDPQPGVTFHIYFLLLGWFAKIVGIPWAVILARAFFAAAFVWLVGRLAWRLTQDVYRTKLIIVTALFGGGLGFLVWHAFGVAIVRTAPPAVSSFLGGLLPIDVWQPEAYAFPSLLTNSLFGVSLCLIVGIIYCCVAAREGWHPVAYGALGMLVLMNIHSYDVAIVTLVMIGLLVASITSGTFDKAWALRCVVIGLGAIPSALWFVYVFKNDPIFAARANVPTLAPTFKQIMFGLGFLPVAAIAGAASSSTDATMRRRLGLALAAFVMVALFIVSASSPDKMWLGWGGFIGLVAVLMVCVALVSGPNTAMNAIWAWALLGLSLPYLPAPFQRKLAMAMAVPWAILAAIGLSGAIGRMEKGQRNLVSLLALLLFCATSVQWLSRDMQVYIGGDVSNTTVHSVYLRRDTKAIVDYLNKNAKGRTTVLAMPGIAEPHETQVDRFKSPYLPDLNPVLSGLTGVYTYAGHWGETPDYRSKRRDATLFFLSGTTDEQRRNFVANAKIDYIVAPVPLAFPEVEVLQSGPPLADLELFGEVVYPGDRFMLIKVQP